MTFFEFLLKILCINVRWVEICSEINFSTKIAKSFFRRTCNMITTQDVWQNIMILCWFRIICHTINKISKSDIVCALLKKTFEVHCWRTRWKSFCVKCCKRSKKISLNETLKKSILNETLKKTSLNQTSKWLFYVKYWEMKTRHWRYVKELF